jgi:hypothetical protein
MAAMSRIEARAIDVVLAALLVACSGGGTIGNPGPGDRPGSTTGAGGAGGSGGGTMMPDAATGMPTGPVTSRAMRLSNAQWERTVQDLFRLSQPLGLSASFVSDPQIGAFDTYGGALVVDSNRFSDYQAAAETVAKKVAHDPQMLATLAPAAADQATRKTNFLRDFGLRAFRRPLTDVDMARYAALFDKGASLIASGDAFVDGVELAVRAFLQSPSFLYRLETSASVVDGRVPLNDYEVASRLSYGLMGTMPDDALFSAAAGRQLQSRAEVATEAQRIVDSSSGQANVLAFHDQLLHLSSFDQISKDLQRAPAFTAEVIPLLKEETLAFVKDVVYGQNRGIAEMLSAPYTFANSKVAKLYGKDVPAPPAGQADPFVRLELDGAERAGFMTQIGFLAFNAIEQTPSIILRGVHVAEDVLCVPLAPPPPVIPPLPPLDPMSTNRERVATLTMNAPCNGCHTTFINPLGFAFETLDGLGRYRTTENGKPIDASAKYTLDGNEVSFDGPVELMKAIAKSQQAHDCYARHLAEFLYGRDLDIANAADRALVSQAGAQAKGTPSVKNLLVSLVTSDVFLNRAPQKHTP